MKAPSKKKVVVGSSILATLACVGTLIIKSRKNS